jgi:hypothetical protein
MPPCRQDKNKTAAMFDSDADGKDSLALVPVTVATSDETSCLHGCFFFRCGRLSAIEGCFTFT